MVVVALVLVETNPVEDVEFHKYLMLLVQKKIEGEGEEVTIGWVVEGVVVTRGRGGGGHCGSGRGGRRGQSERGGG